MCGAGAGGEVVALLPRDRSPLPADAAQERKHPGAETRQNLQHGGTIKYSISQME